MRSKEFANDYRYFPEPDLPPLHVSAQLIEQITASMPVMPAEIRRQLIQDFGLSEYEAGILVEDKEVGDYFFSLIAVGLRNFKATANWVMTEILRVVNESGKTLGEAAPAAAETGALLKMVEDGAISLNAAKTAFAAMVKSGDGAAATVDKLGLLQVSDESAIAAACDRVIETHIRKVGEYRAGRDKLFGFFVGVVMREMGGKGNPRMVNEILQRKLAG
jgi:aspartyl-tRNA(Asn)/glutamyl-tRNA(Gln) amidotransferase subunit B